MVGAANHPPHRRHLFSEGFSVEVHREEEGCGAAYFSATVLPHPTVPNRKKSTSKEKLYLEYHNILAKGEGPGRLREYVEASCVRPAPPPKEEIEGFETGDLVDAFYKNGWWKGVVTRVAKNKRFVVAFDSRPDVIEFGMKELRVHWDGRNWRSTRHVEKNSVKSEIGESSQKRKRGRPRKCPINNNPHTQVTGSAQNGDVASNKCARKDDDLKNNEKTEICESSQKRKRGRPRKLPINNSPHTPVTGNAQNGDDASNKRARKDGDLLRTPKSPIGAESSFPKQELASNESDPNQGRESYLIGNADKEAPNEHVKEAAEKHIMSDLPASHEKQQSNGLKNNEKSETGNSEKKRRGRPRKSTINSSPHTRKVMHRFNHQIAGLELKKSKIDEEISEVNKQMAMLQEKLVSATSAREKEESEIALLQKQLQNIKKKCKDYGVSV